MFGLGVWELAIILCIVVVLFGAGKLAGIGTGLGKGISNFKSEVKNNEIEDKSTVEEDKESKGA